MRSRTTSGFSGRAVGRSWGLARPAPSPPGLRTGAPRQRTGSAPAAVARPAVARVLHQRRGMNHTPPSAWLFGWLVLAAFAAGVLSGAQTVQRALPLP